MIKLHRNSNLKELHLIVIILYKIKTRVLLSVCVCNVYSTYNVIQYQYMNALISIQVAFKIVQILAN